ncbi:hypothetical protein MAHJHV59_49890 [Mycobacterium avium subsp. hominissuis]
MPRRRRGLRGLLRGLHAARPVGLRGHRLLPPSFDPSQVAGYDVATGTWSNEAAYDDQDYAETEQL